MNTIRKRFALFSVSGALLCAALAGCQHPDAKIPEAHPEPWTLSEVENLLGGHDPMEGFNRSMFSCTDFLMNYVADPVGRVYTTVFPRPFIEHLNNVCVNLEYPDRAVSSLLQAEWGAAGDESIRFLANTTLGIAGIFDVARSWWGIQPVEADIGQAFASWGIGPGHTFVLPVASSMNGRDLLGMIFDMAFDLKTYIPYAGSATALNRMVLIQNGYDQVVSGSIDPYKNYRQLMLVRRELQLRAWSLRKACKKTLQSSSSAAPVKTARGKVEAPKPPPEVRAHWIGLADYRPQGAIIDSMRVLLFQVQKDHDPWYLRLSWFNSDFVRQADLRKLALEPGRPKMHYSFWKAPQPAADTPKALKSVPEKLVLLLPGIGGGCTSGTLTALAERFHADGYAVAGFDSTFNWRFITADGVCRLPGYLPEDAERVRRVLRAALDDLRKDQLIKQPEVVLVGYSLGGLQTLKIAELEERNSKVGISRFIAVNPPVSVLGALEKIDKLIETSAGWSKSDIRRRLVETAARQFAVMMRRYPHFDPRAPELPAEQYQIQIDPETARYVAGLYLKLSMRELIFAAHREQPLSGLPVCHWGKRNALYLAIDKITFKDYAFKVLAPRYTGVSPLKLLDESNLRALSNTLRNSKKIRVFHTYDDFLLSREERKWLDEILGSRLTWLSNGGHLGNLYFTEVVDAIVKSAR